MRDEREVGVAGAAEGGSMFQFPPSAPPADPLRLTGGLLLSSEERGWRMVVEVVLLALSLERAREFVKAFGERGGNLHVT